MSFTIKDEYDVGETKEYEVEMELEDYQDSEIFIAVILMTYQDDELKKILVKELYKAK